MSRQLLGGALTPGQKHGLFGQVATVFGNYGTLGLGISDAIAKHGSMLILPHHRSYHDPRQTQLAAMEPWNYTPMETDFHKPAQIKELIEPADHVVVCIGRKERPISWTRWRDMHWGYDAVYRQLPVDIARYCVEAGKETMVYISMIGADENSDSQVLRAKGRAEKEILEIMPSAIIIRPADVFTYQGDHWNDYLKGLARHMCWGSVPCFPEMLSRVSYPVFNHDIGVAVAMALRDPECYGRIFELGGRQRLTLHETMRFISSVTKNPADTFQMPYTVCKALGTVNELCKWNTFWPRDQFVRMQYNMIPNEKNDPSIGSWEDLGIDRRNLIMIEEVAADSLYNYTMRTRTNKFHGIEGHDANVLW